MTDLHAKNVIVGAGAMGCASAYGLARRGEPFLLIEQFAMGHDRGSSHGEARITRHSYGDLNYAKLMPQAFREWRELEALGGRNLYLRTGGVSIAPAGGEYVGQVSACLEEIGCPHRRMSGLEWNAVSPRFRLPHDSDVVFEPDAGLLFAARAMSVELEIARELSGERSEIWTDHPVLRIDLEADRPTILTSTHRITADRLIVTAGPWTHRLVPSLATLHRIERQQVLYFEPDHNEDYRPGRFPVFIFMGAKGHDAFYGMPAISHDGVKVARHGGEAIDPDDTRITIDVAAIEAVRRFLATTLPGLADASIRKTEICRYTMAPADDFLVDFMPERTDVIVASPCSGHGFKFSPLIGRLIADLAVDGESPIERANWAFPARTD